MIAMPPQAVLAHEMRHALANSTGTQRFNVDPQAPPSEPTLAEEEAQAIGAASHANTTPNEHSLRRDLGLPERLDHRGGKRPPFVPALPNLRPGGP